MTQKIAVVMATMSALCFAKPIAQHTIFDVQCSSVDVISNKAELVIPCTIQTINNKSVDDKHKDVSVRFKKDQNGIVTGRVERVSSVNCDTRAVMINFDTAIDSTNTFVALGEPSKECFLSLTKQ